MKSNQNISIINPHIQFGKVSLIEPSKNQFVLLAAEVDRSIFPFFLFKSKKKRRLLKMCKERCAEIEKTKGGVNALLFSASLIPPGRGRLLKERPNVHIAKFDVVVLLEVPEGLNIDEVRSLGAYKEMKQLVSANARNTFFMTASNVKRINGVDHSKQGVFLFNYFYADDLEQNIGIWEYTAAWFQKETGLDNSTVFLPHEPDESQYRIVNHCRWNNLLEIVPSLIFKKTFRSYVLDNFYGNNVAAMPILYKLVW